jgi:hypothetical protein
MPSIDATTSSTFEPPAHIAADAQRIQCHVQRIADVAQRTQDGVGDHLKNADAGIQHTI